MKTQAFYCKHPDGKKLYGELYLPENMMAPGLLVILGHGFTGSYYFLKGYAEYLSSRQIACCIFDFCGGSNYSRSDGEMTDMSVQTQVADLRLLVETLRKHEAVDTQQLYIGGESQGGLVAALTAAEIPSLVAGVILLYPAMYIPELMREQFPDRTRIPEYFMQLGVRLGRRYADDVYETDVYKQIRNYTGRVLILHGDRDGMVPLRYSQKAQEAYSRVKLVIFPGAGHGIYRGTAFRTACKEIEHFIKEK